MLATGGAQGDAKSRQRDLSGEARQREQWGMAKGAERVSLTEGLVALIADRGSRACNAALALECVLDSSLKA